MCKISEKFLLHTNNKRIFSLTIDTNYGGVLQQVIRKLMQLVLLLKGNISRKQVESPLGESI